MPKVSKSSNNDAAKLDLKRKQKAIKIKEKQDASNRLDRYQKYIKETGSFDPTRYKNTGYGSSVEKKKSMATGKPSAYRYGGKK